LLHIITLLYRFENFEQLCASIPEKNDITWHVVISNRRTIPRNITESTFHNLIIHIVDFNDDDFVSKRNVVFEKINNGYFFLLDDDTKYFNSCYDEYRKYYNLEFKGMIVGIQQEYFYKRKPHYPYTNPKNNLLDTGSVISYFEVLKHVKWEWTKDYSRDCFFWANCARYFGENRIINCNKVISYYNFYNSKSNTIKVRKKLKIFTISFEIKNRILGRIYIFLHQFKATIFENLS
jgi:hypothetical protein